MENLIKQLQTTLSPDRTTYSAVDSRPSLSGCVTKQRLSHSLGMKLLL